MLLWRIRTAIPRTIRRLHLLINGCTETSLRGAAGSFSDDRDSQARRIGTSSRVSIDAHPSIPELTSMILDKALSHHVRSLGFTHAALVAAARDLGLSPSITAILERGNTGGSGSSIDGASVGGSSSQEGRLISHFVARCDAQLMQQLHARKDELAAMPLRKRIATAIRLRLEMLQPHIERWPDALATLARPQNSAGAVRQLGVMVDDVWHALGDSSTDLRWYTKRAVLAGVYVSTQVSMLTDFSPGYQDTWALLDKRLEELSALTKQATTIMPNPMADLSIILEAMQASATGISGGGSSSRARASSFDSHFSSGGSHSSSSSSTSTDDLKGGAGPAGVTGGVHGQHTTAGVRGGVSGDPLSGL